MMRKNFLQLYGRGSFKYKEEKTIVEDDKEEKSIVEDDKEELNKSIRKRFILISIGKRKQQCHKEEE